ncbi:MAG TPA: hypothetical protein VFN56_03965 [Candidatus Saccharimonadales bacterium]|nr:hypothetical protein [Candidatus Saccharimonadales bacterium]
MSVEKISRPTFGTEGVPLTAEQMEARATWMLEHGNWRGDHYSPSAGAHYNGYLFRWDETKGMVINARRDDPDRAALEMRTLLSHEDANTGFISNKIFATVPRKVLWDYPEALYFNDNKKGTSYAQPPLEAWAALEIFESYQRLDRDAEGLAFLYSVYGSAEENHYTGLQGSYAYFQTHRQNNADDPLIGIVHPNETGRDSDQANQPWLVNRDGTPGVVRQWLQMQRLGWQLGKLGSDPNGERIDWIPSEALRERYWINDVMFNCLYARNLRTMADIADILHDAVPVAASQSRYARDSEQYRRLATAVEAEILDRMWDSREGFFYNLDKDGSKIPVESATGLFPLLLEHITLEQYAALLDKLEDPTWFATPYPIPTHATRSRFFQAKPSRLKTQLIPPWHRYVWVDLNRFIVDDGIAPRAVSMVETHPLLAERSLVIGSHIVSKTTELLAKNEHVHECYSHETGEGLRVKDFMWSLIGHHFETFFAAERLIRMHPSVAAVGLSKEARRP